MQSPKGQRRQCTVERSATGTATPPRRRAAPAPLLGSHEETEAGLAEEAADTAGGHVTMGLVVAAVTYVGWRIGLYLVQYLV